MTVFDPTFTATHLVGACGVTLQRRDGIPNQLTFNVSRLILTV
jgi:hypothetical protein